MPYQNPFANAFNKEDPELQKMLAAMMQKDMAQMGTPMVPQGQSPYMPKLQGNTQQAQLNRVMPQLTGEQQAAITAQQDAARPGLDIVQKAGSPTAGIALAKTMAAAYLENKGGKANMKKAKVLKKSLESDSVTAQEDKIIKQAIDDRKLEQVDRRTDVMQGQLAETTRANRSREGAVTEAQVLKQQTPAAGNNYFDKENQVWRSVAQMPDGRVIDVSTGIEIPKAEFDLLIPEAIYKEQQGVDADRQEAQDELGAIETTELGILEQRLLEIKTAFPSIERMAGKSKDAPWGPGARLIGGTGPVAGRIPFTTIDKDTQEVERLGNSEALNTLSTLDTPLTPVSDKDMETVMGTGISRTNTEEYNYELATRTMAALEEEIRLRRAKNNKALGIVGIRPAPTGGMGVK